MRLELFGYLLDIDLTATLRAYSETFTFAGYPDGNSVYCENFRAVYFYLPQAMLDALYQMGADPSMPSEIIEYIENPDGTHYYEAWYHIVGKLIREPKSGPADIPLTITNRRDLLPDNFPESAIQIDIFANLPWVLPPLESGEKDFR